MERDKIIQKLQGLYQTRGGQVWASWRSLEDAWFVVKRNGSAIIRSEAQINASLQAIQELGVEQHRNELLKDLNRQLHNFLASAITLMRYRQNVYELSAFALVVLVVGLWTQVYFLGRQFRVRFVERCKGDLRKNWDFVGDWRIAEPNTLLVTGSDEGGLSKDGALW